MSNLVSNAVMTDQIQNEVRNILEANDLDFRIDKVQFVYPNEIAEAVEEVPYFGLINSKTGETINSVKSGYTISQNKEIVEAVVLGSQGFKRNLSVHKAGSINGGRRVFIQLKLNGLAKVGNDVLERYITIIDSNDGSSGLSIGIGSMTMSCSNQFYQFYKSGQLKSKHTISLEGKIRLLPQMIETALAQELMMIKRFQKWQSTPITKQLTHDLVKELTGANHLMTAKELENISGKKRNMMNALYTHIGSEIQDKGENLWGLHSGVTYWTTHTKTAPRRENGRIESVMMGTNYKTADKALQIIENWLAAETV
jgi:hypothetical protein